MDDTDWFSFEIKEKSYIWQEITGFSSFLDNEGLCATLYDENLKELSVLREEDAAFGYATGEQIVVEPGKYYIRVTAQPDYTQSYSIALYANTYVEPEKPGDGDNTGSGTGNGNSGNTGSGNGNRKQRKYRKRDGNRKQRKYRKRDGRRYNGEAEQDKREAGSGRQRTVKAGRDLRESCLEEQQSFCGGGVFVREGDRKEGGQGHDYRHL